MLFFFYFTRLGWNLWAATLVFSVRSILSIFKKKKIELIIPATILIYFMRLLFEEILFYHFMYSKHSFYDFFSKKKEEKKPIQCVNWHDKCFHPIHSHSMLFSRLYTYNIGISEWTQKAQLIIESSKGRFSTCLSVKFILIPKQNLFSSTRHSQSIYAFI